MGLKGTCFEEAQEHGGQPVVPGREGGGHLLHLPLPILLLLLFLQLLDGDLTVLFNGYHVMAGYHVPAQNVFTLPAVLRIRDVYPRSRIRIFPSRILIFSIPNPGSASKNLRILSSRKYDPGCSSRIRIPDPDPDFLTIPEAGSRGLKRHRNPDPQHCSKGEIRWLSSGPDLCVRICLNADPDPAFHLNADKAPGCQANIEPCGSGSWSHKFEFLHEKYTLSR
jgi:hypothetical protein